MNDIIPNADQNIISLNDVSELKVTSNLDIGDSKVTAAAHLLLNYDPEAMVWQDSPSASLMIPSILKWLFIFLIWLIVLSFVHSPSKPPQNSATQTKESIDNKPIKNKKAKANQNNEDKQPKTSNKAISTEDESNNTAYHLILIIGLLVLSKQIYSHIKEYLSIKNITYKMTSQRLTIESGIFSKAIITYELHHLDNGQVFKPWNIRLFERENLYISGIWLLAIKNAEAVRDLIRNAGQIEAGRIDKARFR